MNRQRRNRQVARAVQPSHLRSRDAIVPSSPSPSSVPSSPVAASAPAPAAASSAAGTAAGTAAAGCLRGRPRFAGCGAPAGLSGCCCSCCSCCSCCCCSASPGVEPPLREPRRGRCAAGACVAEAGATYPGQRRRPGARRSTLAAAAAGSGSRQQPTGSNRRRPPAAPPRSCAPRAHVVRPRPRPHPRPRRWAPLRLQGCPPGRLMLRRCRGAACAWCCALPPPARPRRAAAAARGWRQGQSRPPNRAGCAAACPLPPGSWARALQGARIGVGPHSGAAAAGSCVCPVSGRAPASRTLGCPRRGRHHLADLGQPQVHQRPLVLGLAAAAPLLCSRGLRCCCCCCCCCAPARRWLGRGLGRRLAAGAHARRPARGGRTGQQERAARETAAADGRGAGWPRRG